MLNDFLYHYTSIETLALILKNRKIRLNCLKYVDDPEETISRDAKDVGRLCVVSCWTDIEEDTLPMWNMYTPNMKGVRLRMKTYPFMSYKPFLNFPIEFDKSYVDEKKILLENKAMIILPSLVLEEVVYTDDESLLNPVIYTDQNGYNVDYIGKYKRSCWSFQSEWRYKILFTPFNRKELIKENRDAKISDEKSAFNKFYSGRRIPYKEFYLDLSEDAFEESEIILGPRTSDAEKIIVESLVEKYQGNYKITVNKSDLQVR